jgi:hypothetical protein
VDRPPRRPRPALIAAGLLTGGLLAGVLAAAALASDGDPPIRALHWIAPGADLARAIATQPSECLDRPADPKLALSVEVGRAAFRTPVLLGGQAARASLACETCHRAGRTNPDFQFPGVSGAPGTADVTDSLFSSHRGDGVDNPKPIPDLSGPRAALKVDRSPGSRALETFIHGLVTEEFDGPEPAPAVLRGLADYVRALSPQACPAAARERMDVALLMDDARRAIAAARAEAALGDRPTAILMLAAARARLGLIDERLAGASLRPLHEALRAASLALADAQETLRSGGRVPDAALAGWLTRSRPLQAELTAAEPRTLFDPRRLAAAAKRRLPG